MFSLVIMLLLSPLLTLVAFVAVPPASWWSLRLRTAVFPATWDAQQRAAEMRASSRRPSPACGWSRASARRTASCAPRRRVEPPLRLPGPPRCSCRPASPPLLQAIPALGQVAVLALGGWLALHGHITLGTFLAFSTYLVQLVARSGMLAVFLAVGQQARAGAERISTCSTPTRSSPSPTTPSTCPAAPGEVAFDHVTASATAPAEPVLDDFTLTVAPGETVALVGASGSGKSTVALLLPRFYDVPPGAVRIDGIDVRDVTLDVAAATIGVVFEDSFLFSDSVRANIAFGRPDATDDEVEAAARAAEAHEFIIDAARRLRHRRSASAG